MNAQKRQQLKMALQGLVTLSLPAFLSACQTSVRAKGVLPSGQKLAVVAGTDLDAKADTIIRSIQRTHLPNAIFISPTLALSPGKTQV